ncbi:MAG: 5-dehydro-2-deoxygluconokinase [Melioribacteraceae bacterium]|nr:5-dehydro-2-deoxygluconokinase [Melioribacteraceae bacterium]MCF8413094.1 5-dehydro-2-deoxygluconokinase [Melioribacteraceae bacterium]MCF8432378.1 5-dehydro-2-deoxygluconokinase [Melioribacteraceae bacterium]
MQTKKYDIITFGRSSIDLYSNDIGSRFEDITNFAAYVGGSPLNIAVGCSRLGLKSALITGLGEDKVGSFILKFLKKENVETKFIPIVKTARTSAVILGIEPPDKFPLVYYRDNCADIEITIDDVIKANIENARLLEISGTALSRDPSRSSAFFAAEQAYNNGIPVLLDLDFRADQWDDIRAFGVMSRALLSKVKIAIGTEEEIKATMLSRLEQVSIKDQQISAPEITGDIDLAIAEILKMGPEILIVKRGEKGASYHHKDGFSELVQGFPVQVTNILGAGDAFASGFIYGYLKGWNWHQSIRMGNASGAIVVTRHGCANFMPYEKEALEFVENNGGF